MNIHDRPMTAAEFLAKAQSLTAARNAMEELRKAERDRTRRERADREREVREAKERRANRSHAHMLYELSMKERRQAAGSLSRNLSPRARRALGLPAFGSLHPDSVAA